MKFDVAGEAPPARRAHTAVLRGTTLWIFGGGTGSKALNDLWSLDVEPNPSEWMWVCWKPRNPLPSNNPMSSSSKNNNSRSGGGPPSANNSKKNRSRAQSNASDFGGGGGEQELRDTPTLKHVDGPWPAPRGYHSANIVFGMMIVLGGSDGATSFDDLWLFDFRESPLHYSPSFSEDP